MESKQWFGPSFFSFLRREVTLRPARSQLVAHENVCFLKPYNVIPKLYYITRRNFTSPKLTIMELQIHR